MCLDLDCVRDLLIYLEKTIQMDDHLKTIPVPVTQIHKDFKMSKYSLSQIAYTCKKLSEGGFISLQIKWNTDSDHVLLVEDITYAGLQMLESIRSPQVYRKTKNTVQKVGSYSLDIVKEVASSIITNMILSSH